MMYRLRRGVMSNSLHLGNKLETLLERDAKNLKVNFIDDFIGKGVFAAEEITCGELVAVYHGELISEREAEERESNYEKKNYGSYLYFFEHHGQRKCIDATFSNRIGKYFNDNPAKDANCKMRLEEHQGLPVLVLYSKRSISRGEELRYDYGVPDLPWRKNAKRKQSTRDCTYKRQKVDECKSDNKEQSYDMSDVNDLKDLPSTCHSPTFDRFVTSTTEHERVEETDCESCKETEDILNLSHSSFHNQVERNDSLVADLKGNDRNLNDMSDAIDIESDFKSLQNDSGINGDFPEILDTDEEKDGKSSDEVSDIEVDDYEDEEDEWKPTREEKKKIDGESDSSDNEFLDNLDNDDCNGLRSGDRDPVLSYNDDDVADQDTNPAENVTINDLASGNRESDGDTVSVVTVPRAQTKNNGGRLYNKLQACYFCSNEYLKIARHLLNVHKDEPEIIRILALNPTVCEENEKRTMELARLRLKGNFYHNLKVLRTGGALKVLRRPSDDQLISPQQFVPCKLCLGFVQRHELWRHTNKCPFKIKAVSKEEYEEKMNRKLQHESELLLFPNRCPDGSSSGLSNAVLGRMKNDKISFVVKRDKLILMYGNLLYEQHGASNANYTSQKMRVLSRLMLKLRCSSENSTDNLIDFICPEKFDSVVEATRSISGFTSLEGPDEVPKFQTPSLALKIGHALKSCAMLKRGIALRAKDREMADDVVGFLSLLENEWSFRISTAAVRTLADNQFKNEEVLPLTSDLLKLRCYILSKMTSVTKKINLKPSLILWRQLAELTVSRIILFNKRRSKEGNKMRMDEFKERPKWGENNIEEIGKSLQPLEIQLCKRLELVYLKGKRRRKVPVVMTKEVVQAIKVLNNHRETAGVSQKNPFVFAAPTRQAVSALRGNECLTSVVANCPDLEKPDLLKSTKLRKYIATVSQIAHLNEGELEWLARHLGHDVSIHREYYRLQESTLELSKVSRLLMAVDAGNSSRWVGKKLSDIDIDDLPLEDEEGEGNNNIEEEDCNQEIDDDIDDLAGDFDGDELAFDEPPSRPPNRPLKNNDGRDRRRRKYVKIPWTQEESAAVFSFFGRHIRQNKLPGKALCDECIKLNPCLLRRSWKNVKDYVRNQMSKVPKR